MTPIGSREEQSAGPMVQLVAHDQAPSRFPCSIAPGIAEGLQGRSMELTQRFELRTVLEARNVVGREEPRRQLDR